MGTPEDRMHAHYMQFAGEVGLGWRSWRLRGEPSSALNAGDAPALRLQPEAALPPGQRSPVGRPQAGGRHRRSRHRRSRRRPPGAAARRARLGDPSARWRWPPTLPAPAGRSRPWPGSSCTSARTSTLVSAVIFRVCARRRAARPSQPRWPPAAPANWPDGCCAQPDAL